MAGGLPAGLPSALLLSTALAALAVWKKALTPGGTALVWLLCVLICAFGGLPAFWILAAVFLCTVAAGRFAGERADPHGLRRKSGRRDAVRVFCNVGVGAAALLLSALLRDPSFRFVYAAVLAESLADSLASKLGPLSHGKTRDFFGLRPVEKGLSGGVSLWGTAASLLGAALVGLLSLLFGWSLRLAALITLLGFLGALLDSAAGSLLQVKYRCPVCGALTEQERHCGVLPVRAKGLRRVNNDVVNLLSNLSVFAAALAIIRSF